MNIKINFKFYMLIISYISNQKTKLLRIFICILYLLFYCCLYHVYLLFLSYGHFGICWRLVNLRALTHASFYEEHYRMKFFHLHYAFKTKFSAWLFKRKLYCIRIQNVISWIIFWREGNRFEDWILFSKATCVKIM